MRLTIYADYGLRILTYLGTQTNSKLISIKDISDTFQISNNHITKIVTELGKLELIETIRGRNGGIRLMKAPKEINIGFVVRQIEQNLDIVECFNEKESMCKISPSCRLKHMFREALNAFFKVLDSYTLEDVLCNRDILIGLLN